MDFTVGQIMLKGFDFAPAGALACNGQLVSTQAYGALFGVLAASYGGDGISTFGVPNLPPVPTQSGAALDWVILADGAPWYSGMEAAVGEVRLLPALPPVNSTLAQTFVPCDGRELSVSSSGFLFALLGTQFGGDGVDTFAVPKLAPVSVANGPPLAYYICIEGYFPPIDSGDSVTPTPGSYVFETYLGSVLQLPYVPQLTQRIDGLGLCLGQTMPILTWTAVFSLLGTRFGGNGTTNFALPARSTGSDGVTYAVVVNGIYPSRD
jgi:microcystin-dependent protein